jgi:hypothetical protein
MPRMAVLERLSNYQYMALSQEGVYKTIHRLNVASTKTVCLVTLFYISLGPQRLCLRMLKAKLEKVLIIRIWLYADQFKK